MAAARRADRVGESGWRNDDDLPRLLVQVERPANNVRRAAELLLPVGVAEDDDTVASDDFAGWVLENETIGVCEKRGFPIGCLGWTRNDGASTSRDPNGN